MTMKKVLYVVPEGIDLGGIITSTEQLLQGFRDIHCERVTFALLRPLKNSGLSISMSSDQPAGYTKGKGTGLWVHPIKGWKGPFYALGDAGDMNEFIRMANTHDVVIWGSLYGLRNKLTEGNTAWLRLFEKVRPPHIAMIRDDHLTERYPWVERLEYWIVGWGCVQQSSFDSCAGLRRPRAITYSGHDIIGSPPKTWMPPILRDRQVFNLQTFKRWKKADRLIAAIPHLNGIKVSIAGDGIELRYMRSPDKCRPAYICDRYSDPEAYDDMLGNHIWDNALAYGMNYMGSISEAERDYTLDRSMQLIDMSLRQSTGQINRVVVEAIKRGVVVMATNQFISGTPDGNGRLFKAGEHYLPIDPEETPHSISQRIRAAVEMPLHTYGRIAAAAYDVARQFDRRNAARGLLLLAQGAKVPEGYAMGKADDVLLRKGDKMFNDIFGG